MKELKKISIVLLVVVYLFSSSFSVFADDKTLELTIEDAVKIGLENSIALKQVDAQIEQSKISRQRAQDISDQMYEANMRITSGETEIGKIESALAHGVAPFDIPLPDGSVIPAGSPIPAEIIEQIRASIGSNKMQLEYGNSLLNANVSDAVQKLSDKLGMESIYELDVHSTRRLMVNMAQEVYDVTKASQDIYRNQIAMLIQKNYYDVLKAQKMVDVKKKAMERGKKQYQFADDSYDAGMKAKDDVLLAELYYKGTQLEMRKVEGDLENALIELKKNMNIPLDTKIVLSGVLSDEVEKQDLDFGLRRGFEKRLEIKQAAAQVRIHDINFQSVNKTYSRKDNEYQEADNLRTKARLNYDEAKLNVEASIRQSHQLVESLGEMLEISKDMVAKAKESVEIAEFKYTEGFGTDTSLLKKLDLEAAAGTMVDVLAAEENLAQIEEKVVEIMYGYNLAKMKYFNDSGKFVY